MATSDERETTDAVQRLLDAAEELFYARGIQAVGMDQVRDASGISLKRIYQLFHTKNDLVIAMLDRRDTRWRKSLEGYVGKRPATEGVDAIFDWLQEWFASPGFRGCAWINAFGELGMNADVVAAVRSHKRAFHDFVSRTVVGAGFAAGAATAVCLLAEGAIVNASIDSDPRQAALAKDAAAHLSDRIKH